MRRWTEKARNSMFFRDLSIIPVFTDVVMIRESEDGEELSRDEAIKFNYFDITPDSTSRMFRGAEIVGLDGRYLDKMAALFERNPFASHIHGVYETKSDHTTSLIYYVGQNDYYDVAKGV